MGYTKKQKQALISMVAFRRAERAISRDEGRVCREYGITPIQFGVMERLYSKGDLRIGELMDELLSTPGNMTVVVKNMERDGFISRKQDETDKRSFLLVLTDKGRRLIDEMLPKHVALVEEIWSVLSVEEQKGLTEILKKLYKNKEKENG